MAVAAPRQDNLLQAPRSELAELEELARRIGELLEEGGKAAKLVGPRGKKTEIPPSALHALKLVADGMAHGLVLTLIPHGRELTTQEAADILHVSRPHLVKLLDEGAIPHHRVGTHRRVRIEDVLAYRAERARRRREQLRELTRLSEEAEGGYV